MPAGATRAASARWTLVALVAASVVPYLNALPNEFVWDDLVLIVGNPLVKSWSAVPHLFTSSLVVAEGAAPYYRPLQALTYALDYQVWGLTPAGFRATGILFHAGVTLLLYRLGRDLLGSPRAALVAALLFAVHPIHTEAVTYVAGRSDPIGALCMLGALVCVVERRAPAFGLALFGLALLARESSMILPLLVLLLELARRPTPSEAPRLRGALVRAAPYLVVLVAYVLVRRAVVDDTSLARAYAVGVRMLTMPGVIARYLGLLAVPIGLHMERAIAPAESLFDPAVGAGVLVVAALLGIAVVSWNAARPVAVGIVWFLIALLPVSGLVPLPTFMAEHWLYVPSMGIFFAVGWAVDRAFEKRGAWVATLAVGAVFVYAALTMRRNVDWRDNLTLFEATLPYAPYSIRVHAGLGLAYAKQGRPNDAIAAYERALAANPWPLQAAAIHNNLGNLYRGLGRLEDSRRELEEAIRLDPRATDAMNNLAATMLALGRPDEAEQLFENALRLDPNSPATQSNLGALYGRRGDLERARVAFMRALELDPDSAEAHSNLGSIYLRLGDLPRAEHEYRAALSLNPGIQAAQDGLQSIRARGDAH